MIDGYIHLQDTKHIVKLDGYIKVEKERAQFYEHQETKMLIKVEDDLTQSRERLNLNLPRDMVINLRTESEHTYTTMTGLVVAALQLRQFMKDQKQQGSKVIIEDKHGKQREIYGFYLW